MKSWVIKNIWNKPGTYILKSPRKRSYRLSLKQIYGQAAKDQHARQSNNESWDFQIRNKISMKSGKQVELNMDLNRFRPFLIEVRGTKCDYKLESKSLHIDKNDFSLTIGKRKIRFDAVFNAIHGSPGHTMCCKMQIGPC